MIGITLIVNGLDIGNKLSTYSVDKEIQYKKIITTLDNSEHPVSGSERNIVRFSMVPMTEEEAFALHDALSDLVFDCTFTENGSNKTEFMRLASDLHSAFLLTSVDGKRRYRCGQIVLRGVNIAGS